MTDNLKPCPACGCPNCRDVPAEPTRADLKAALDAANDPTWPSEPGVNRDYEDGDTIPQAGRVPEDTESDGQQSKGDPS